MIDFRYPGSGVVLDCIDSWSLHPYLLIIYHISPDNLDIRHFACSFYLNLAVQIFRTIWYIMEIVLTCL